MQRFTLEIDCENDAFYPDPGDEVARILRAVADSVDSAVESGTVRDINGNTVGRFHLTQP